jgi:RNA polymerase sigma-70 factor (sigma-E family)
MSPGAAPTRDRSPSGFESFYREHYRSVVFLAYATTQSVEEAENLAQEAFLQLCRRWDRVDLPEHWIRRAAASLCVSWVRRRVRDRVFETRTLARSAADAYEVDLDVRQDVAQMLSRLPARQRLAVVLRYVDDLSEADIAKALQCRPGTVKSLLSRARESLKVGVTYEAR